MELCEKAYNHVSATQHQNRETRQEAESRLKQWELSDTEEFMRAQMLLLCDGTKDAYFRHLAGILLKNAVSSKDFNKDKALKDRWQKLGQDTKQFIRCEALKNLVGGNLDYAMPEGRALLKAIASFLANLAVVDVLNNQWLDLISTLKSATTSAAGARPALIALGYISEEFVLIPEEELDKIRAQINDILYAVIEAMSSADAEVRFQGTKAFYFAVLLARKVFERKEGRDGILNVVTANCNCAVPNDTRVAAFECLVQIAQDYYQYLSDEYMNSEDHMKFFHDLTAAAINGPHEVVALPAMEFWSTICDEEMYLLDDIRNSQGATSTKHPQIIMRAREKLVPMLLATLPRHDGDCREWNLAMAAATCLQLTAQVVGDAIVDQVLDYVGKAVLSQDWKIQEAGILAYGSIVEGASMQKIGPSICTLANFVLNFLKHDSEDVRDTAVWTMGRICKFHYGILEIRELVSHLLAKLNPGKGERDDTPRVVANVCFVFHVIAEKQGDPSNLQATTELSEFFKEIVCALMRVAGRGDAMEEQLMVGAFNALAVLISRIGVDCERHFPELTATLIKELSLVNGKETKDRECTIQGLICGCLQALTQRMKLDVEPFATMLMEQYIRTFQIFANLREIPCLLEETLQAVGALARAIRAKFEPYMEKFHPILCAGLEQSKDVTVCRMSTAVVGDLCRVLEKKFARYAGVTIEKLLPLLDYENMVDRSILPGALLVFGDIAMAIGGDFEPYFPLVKEKLILASKTTIENLGGPQNDDAVSYLNSLRDGILEAYTGIIHGFRECGKLDSFKNNVNHVLDFIKVIVADYIKHGRNRVVSDEVMKFAAGLIGDLIYVYQTELISSCFQQDGEYVRILIQFCEQLEDDSTQKTVTWLKVLIQKYSGSR